MRILVIGGGGREHALVWKLAQSPQAERIYCAPGNAGIARMAECINLRPTDLDGLANFASNMKIDLTVVGPEVPLMAGIVDRFEARGLPIFGPATDPARLEGSKVFAKDIMARYGIPTAWSAVCDTASEAHEWLERHYAGTGRMSDDLVIKADGLAAGKGVIMARSAAEAHAAVSLVMEQRAFGSAGDRLLFEECLTGPEVSVMAFTDGENVAPMPPSQDHKRVFDGDEGPNTGGMGAYSPVPVFTDAMMREAVDTVLRPAVRAIRDLGIPYKGVLYAGLMLTPAGMRVLEFNCRFGDPETQAVLPLLDCDLVSVMQGCVECRIDDVAVPWKAGAAVCVVASSGGYPGDYATGVPIDGLDRAAAADCLVFHAGTRAEAGECLTDGGRVLGVTGVGADFAAATARAYEGLAHIRFDGMHYRRDIAKRAIG